MQWAAARNVRLDQAAISISRLAVERHGDVPESWLTLFRALSDAGETAEASDALDRALVRFPQDPALHLAKARMLKNLGDYRQALVSARAAMVLAPDERDAAILLFELLTLTRSDDEAARLFDAVRDSAPENLQLFAHCERTAGAAAMLALSERCLAASPAHTEGQYRRAMALAALERPDEARAALALDATLSLEDLGNGPAFHDALEAEIRRNPTLASDPRGKATRGGLQTRELRQPDARDGRSAAWPDQGRRRALRAPFRVPADPRDDASPGHRAPVRLGCGLRQRGPPDLASPPRGGTAATPIRDRSCSARCPTAVRRRHGRCGRSSRCAAASSCSRPMRRTPRRPAASTAPASASRSTCFRPKPEFRARPQRLIAAPVISSGTQSHEPIMAKPQTKPHDLRDDIYQPRLTPTDTDETFVGAPPPAVDPETGNLRLMTPTPGKGVPEGATTKG